MVPGRGLVVLALFLNVLALRPARAQSAPLLSDADAHACFMQAHQAVAEIQNRRINANAAAPEGWHPVRASSAQVPNRLHMVLFIGGLELVLAILVAIACCFVPVIAGLWLKIEDRAPSIQPKIALPRLPAALVYKQRSSG